MTPEQMLHELNVIAEKKKNNDCDEDTTDCHGCSECTYTEDCVRCHNCTCCLRCVGCSCCSGCTDCWNCIGSDNCDDSCYLTYCSNCTDCYACYGIDSKQYMICNVQLTAEEYEEKLKELKE